MRAVTGATEPAAAFDPVPLKRHAFFYVAHHRGLVGLAIWQHLQQQRFSKILGRP